MYTPGREHHDGGVVARRRGRHRLQRVQQRQAVVVDRADAVVGEDLGQDAGHGLPVLEHVGDAGRVAEVVLEHAVPALAVADDVDAGHEAPRAVGHRDADRLAAEAVGRRHQPPRHDAVADGGSLAGVEVVEEAVEDGDPLDQAPLDVGPLVGRDEARHEVHREGALDPFALAVDGERDASGPERLVAQPFSADSARPA